MISIILPVYNGELYIKDAIDSVKNQTYKNWELIIIDDCSTDNTAKICMSYCDVRIKYFKNEVNMRLPKSLNIGFSKASGDYFTWTSDDNILHFDFLEQCRSVLKRDKEISLLYSNMKYIDEKGIAIKDIATNSGNPNELVIKNVVGASFMYPAWAKKIVGDYDHDKFLVEDYDYWLRLSMIGKVKKIDEYLYSYRFHSNSLTATRKQDIIRKTNDLLYCFLLGYQGENKGIAFFALGVRKLKVHQISGFLYLIKGILLEPKVIIKKIVNKIK